MAVLTDATPDRRVRARNDAIKLIDAARPVPPDGLPEIDGQPGSTRIVQAARGNRRGQRRDRRVEIDRLRQTKARGHRDVIALGPCGGQVRGQYPTTEGSPGHCNMNVVTASVAVAHGDPGSSEWIDPHQPQLKVRDHVPLRTACLHPFGQRQRDMQIARASCDALEPLAQIMAPGPGNGSADQLCAVTQVIAIDELCGVVANSIRAHQRSVPRIRKMISSSCRAMRLRLFAGASSS